MYSGWIHRLLLSCGCLAACSAQAQGQGVAIGAGIGTLGLGLDASLQVSPQLAIRGQLHGLSFDYTHRYDGIDYDGTVDLQSVGVVADLFPKANRFRLSGGLYLNSNELRLNATDSDSYQIGNFSYELEGTMNSHITFNKTAAYVGLGFGNPMLQGATPWHVGFDLGVLFQGSPSAEVTGSGRAINQSSGEAFEIGDNSVAAQQLDQQIEQEEQNLNRALKDWKYFPVLSLTLNYRF